MGGREAGSGPYGAQDLAGNAAEWVADWFAEGFLRGDVRNPKGPEGGKGKGDSRRRMVRPFGSIKIEPPHVGEPGSSRRRYRIPLRQRLYPVRLMPRTSIGRLRAIGVAEAVSFLMLLGIAMPLKYFANLPRAVTIAGWLHGILFLAFFIALMQTREAMKWDTRRTGMVLLAGLLPFGPFVIDSSLKREDETVQQRGQKA